MSWYVMVWFTGMAEMWGSLVEHDTWRQSALLPEQ